jgi:hypothetical protein
MLVAAHLIALDGRAALEGDAAPHAPPHSAAEEGEETTHGAQHATNRRHAESAPDASS